MTPIRFFRDALELTELLLLEGRDRPNNTGGEGERTGKDPAGLHCGLERAPPHFGAQRLKEGVAGLRHSSGEHDDVGIEDVEEIGNASAEDARCLADDLSGRRVAAL